MVRPTPARRVRASNEPPPPSEALRRKVESFLYRPAVELVVLGLIVLSVALVMGELLETDPWRLKWILRGNAVITWVFAVELSVRYWVARSKSRFFRTYWLDILAVLPLVRALRVFRVFRVLRLLRAGVLWNRRVVRPGEVFGGPAEELSVLVAVSFTIVVGAAVLLYDAEGGSTFSSFSEALWFAMLSLAAGEPVGQQPTSAIGRWTTLGLMIGGLSVFGMFVATVSAGMVARLSKGLGMQEMGIDELRGHVIVCGWNGSGPTMVRELFGPTSDDYQSVVIVTEGEEAPPDIPRDAAWLHRLYTLQGDYTRIDVLEKAGLLDCASVILLADTTVARSDQDRDARTVLAALTMERLVPGLFTVAELVNRDNASLLEFAGVEEIVVGDWYAGVVLGNSVRSRGIVRMLDEILTTSHGNAFHSVRLPSSLAGRTVAEVHHLLIEQNGAVLVSVERGGNLVVNPAPSDSLEAGDQLHVLSREPVRL